MSKLNVMIDDAREEAVEAFWAVIAKRFPSIKTGDMPMDILIGFDERCEELVAHWIENNSEVLTKVVLFGTVFEKGKESLPGLSARMDDGTVLLITATAGFGLPTAYDWRLAAVNDDGTLRTLSSSN